jgi:hypothetical protein
LSTGVLFWSNPALSPAEEESLNSWSKFNKRLKLCGSEGSSEAALAEETPDAPASPDLGLMTDTSD